MPNDPCPSRQELAGYQAGTLDEERAEPVTAHLAGCADCETVIQNLQLHGDGLLSALRQPAPAETFVDEAECRRAVEAIAAHAPAALQAAHVADGRPSTIFRSNSHSGGQITPMTRDDFVQCLLAAGLVSPDELAALTSQLSAEENARADAQHLAHKLVEQGKLTKYQAAAVYQGKAKGLVFGEYTVLDRIGAGGMGQVLKAQHRRMQRTVALKVLPAATTRSPEAVRRFHREMQAAARLSHPNIVTAHDAGEQEGVHYLVMEYVAGADLASVVKNRGPLPVAQALDYMIQAARGLEHAHAQGIIHRDIKPANLLLDKTGVVKVLDLGLARMDAPLGGQPPADGLSATGNIMGTVDFMSPEQALDAKHTDHRCDIYSLGCTLYYLLTGHKLYDGDTVMKKLMAHRDAPIPAISAGRNDVTAEVQAVFRKMVAKNPADRYPTMTETRIALEAALAGNAMPPAVARHPAPIPLAKPPAVASSPQRPIAQPGPANQPPRRRVFAGVLVAGLLALGLGGWLLYGAIFRVKTAEGTIVVEVSEPGAEIILDEQQRLTLVASGGGEAVSVQADPGTHSLSVRKGGFKTYTHRFVVNEGQPSEIKVYLEPVAAATVDQPAKAADRYVANVPAATAATPDKPPAAQLAPAAQVPAAPAPVQNVSLDRQAAEWALGLGGRVIIGLTGSQPKPVPIEKAADLPAGDFNLVGIDLWKDQVANLRVTDAELAHLAGLKNLHSLVLDQTPVTAAGMKHLSGLKALRSLALGNTKIGDAGLAELENLSLLESLSLTGAGGITAAGIKHLEGLKELNNLQLGGVGSIDDEALGSIGKLHKLRTLPITSDLVTDSGVAQLEPLSELRVLVLRCPRLTDEVVETLLKFKNLTDLLLSKTRLDDSGALRLAALAHLRMLDLTETQVTAEGVRTLQTALPACKIGWTADTLAGAKPAAPPSSPPPSHSASALAPRAAGARLPVPSVSQQQQSLVTFKEVFQNDLAAAKKPEEKTALAEKLLKQVEDFRDDAVANYVLLNEAGNQAVDAADAAMLVRIATVIGIRYDVDPLGWLADNLQRASQKSHPLPACKAVAEAALARVDEALAADALEQAKKLTDAGLAAARKSKDPALLKLAISSSKSVALVQQQSDAAQAAEATLATSPEDRTANLALGKYLCFVKHDWSRGLPRLAKGNDTKLKELATSALAGPHDATVATALADDWWKAAETAKSKNKPELQLGARYWYSLAVTDATGLVKVKIEQRLAELGGRETLVKPAVAQTGATAAHQPGAPSDAAQDRQVAQWVLAHGGKVSINFGSGPAVDVTVASDLPPEPFLLRNIDMRGNKELTDADLAQLVGLGGLQSLGVSDTSIGDGAAKYIGQVPTIKVLELYNTQIGDAALADFARLPLIAIFMGGTKITDAGMALLPKSINSMSLSATQVTGAGLAHLVGMNGLWFFEATDIHITDQDCVVFPQLPKLRLLALNRNHLTDAALAAIGRTTTLKDLRLSEDQITDAGLEQLRGLSKLTRLDVNYTAVTDDGVKALQLALPDCKIDHLKR